MEVMNMMPSSSSDHFDPKSSYYFSAPTSPCRHKPQEKQKPEADDIDFVFDFDVSRTTSSLSAEDLFHGGVIKSPNPPPPPPISKSSSQRAALHHIQYPWEQEQEQDHAKTSSAGSISTTKGQKKWKVMDFFLFRSASEGRAADKDPLKKYALRRSSFRAIGSRQVSAHELHYTMNRAISEDLKKKTFLPYKQGILGRLAFNPAANALANGFGLSPTKY